MEAHKIDYKITEAVTLQFHLIRDTDYYPKVVMGTDAHNVPLLISEDEIPKITKVLDLITFKELPLHYIGSIVAGCISVLLKRH
jgi:hypothetical protein